MEIKQLSIDIKDLDEIGKKFLDTALASNGYKITAKRITKGEK